MRQGNVVDVYQYAELPQALRVQIVHLIWDFLGSQDEYLQSDEYFAPEVRNGYKEACNIICREHGLFRLNGKAHHQRDYIEELCNYILQAESIEVALDAIEVAAKIAEFYVSQGLYRHRRDPASRIQSAVEELNARLKEHGVGYQLERFEFIRVDSTLTHAEIVKPALAVLADKRFVGADQELREAFEHYRHQRFKETLVCALKAFESTMKVACGIKRIPYGDKDTAKALLDHLFGAQLIPAYWGNHFAGLRSVLEAGVPTARNRDGGHGQGEEIKDVPEHLVAYVLHQTASAILFIYRAVGL